MQPAPSDIAVVLSIWTIAIGPERRLSAREDATRLKSMRHPGMAVGMGSAALRG